MFRVSWQFAPIRKVPVSTIRSVFIETACEEVSTTLYTLITSFPHKIEVHIAVVGQKALPEFDLSNSLTMDLHQSREEAQQDTRHCGLHDNT